MFSREGFSTLLKMITLLFSFSCAAKLLKAPKVLVLGGTGFVGSNFINVASKKGYQIVSLSRRGEPPSGEYNNGVQWIKGDATDNDLMKDVFKNYGPFDACVHAIGLLFDAQSGLKSLNSLASGSSSEPDDTATYDAITRQTASNAIDCFAGQRKGKRRPFIFVSAAEAGWTFKAPLDFLERYLVAKRSVESKLLRYGGDGPLGKQQQIRPVIFRPSLIWTKEKPAALLSLLPFYIGNKLGLPFVDRPVNVNSLVEAMQAAIADEAVEGVQRFREIDTLSSS